MESKEEPGFRTLRGYQIFDRDLGRLSPAVEDYLEMIFRQCKDAGYTRVGKLSSELHVKPSSASKMIALLAREGYLKYERYEIIQLTEQGKKLGEYLLSRHNIVAEFLTLIGSGSALEEVEIIEHPLSAATVNNIKILLGFFEEHPAAKAEFDAYRKSRTEPPPTQP
jgi:DtxR family Mn-dependent transcriptional regulator